MQIRTDRVCNNTRCFLFLKTWLLFVLVFTNGKPDDKYRSWSDPVWLTVVSSTIQKFTRIMCRLTRKACRVVRASRGIGLLQRMCKMIRIPRIRIWRMCFLQDMPYSPEKDRIWGTDERDCRNDRRTIVCILCGYLVAGHNSQLCTMERASCYRRHGGLFARR